jgi:hypothetical protein
MKERTNRKGAPIQMSTPHLPTSFTRRQILQSIAALSASAMLSGCTAALSNSSAAATPLPQVATDPQPTPSGPLTQATLSVSAAATGTIGAGFAGLSYEKSSLTEPLFTGSNSDLIGLFKLLGPSVLRIGGDSVDVNVWTPNGKGQTAGQIAPSDVAALAAFVKAAGWQCIYGINLGGAATGATTPALAAAEVAYAAEQFGSSLLGIEVGNECDDYGASYFADNWSLARFESLWGQFRSAILAESPGVAITGPASAGNEGTWTVPFGQSATRNQISLLTQHYYRGNGQSSTATAANLVSSDTNLPPLLATLNSGAKSVGIPYRMAECNSYFNGGASGVSDSYASALWVIDFLFNCAQGGASGVNLHGGGDYTGYTPIADASGVVVGPRPEYYGMLLFTLAGQGTLYQTQLSANGLNATAYAVKTATGGLNLVLVNKDPTQSLELTALLPQAVHTATLIAMTQLSTGAAAPSLTATSGLAIQGTTIDPSGAFSPSAPYNLAATSSSSTAQVACYVPALSAVLIQIA